MNKFKLFPLALAAFAFSACTSEDAVENNPNVEGVKSYVAVNINNVGVGGTRADGATYENGTEAESKINTIRFYFFTSDGAPYKLAEGTNWLELRPNQMTPSTGNVENITNSMLVISGKDQSYPQSMMAVVNPETIEDGKLTDFMTKSQVEGVVTAQNFNGQSATASDFVMTSSVYANGKDKVWTSDISGHVALSEDEAKADPVDIYVERVAAKITSTASGATESKFKVGETATGTPVYAMIKGWGIAKENTTANLIKVIEPTWTEAKIGFNWNDANFYRSYWETTPNNDGTYKSWADYTHTAIGDVYYTAPNTSYAETRPIYVAAAQLVDATGNPLEISKYKGVQYLSENDVKKVILNENKNFFKVVSTTDARTDYETLDPADLVFVVDTHKPYEVKAQVKDGVVVYKKTGETYVVATDAANAAYGANNAVIYKDGMTYYWTSVKHLGAAGKTGEFGMVRNHFYQVDVTKITGFGTAVYDKNTGFVPVTPDEDPMTYLAARINVLSWRVVANGVELGK
ncbi:Mfa1 family fimbria major subunit [Prevotella sp.]|uniref:Mfa1 family fimbria major subunit n=1 Tax=Prevotella sp. TaxID=59823 RepID=UPI0025E83113|nr:Mfa1 family fimbria major subunit [Prevotella sp.]